MQNVDQSIFKAYDIRGTYPDQLNEEIAEGVVKGVISILQPATIIIGRDGRTSGPSLHKVVLETLTKHGVNVIDIGQVSTDMYYYACATKKLPGIMITASHNPKEYNGFKMVREIPYFFTGDDEIKQIKDMILNDNFPNLSTTKTGSVTNLDVMDDFITKVLGIVDANKFAKFKIVADTANGMVGPILEKLQSKIPNVELIPMYFEPDGNFPNHGGDPLDEENRHDIEKKIKEVGADFGVMFDPDGDRFFVVDSKQRFVAGDFMTAIMSENFLAKQKGAKIVYDIRASKAVPDAITRLGGVPLYNRVGHSYIKKRMMEENAVFGGEVSGHYYFAHYFYCDSGTLAFLVLLDYLSKTGKNLTQIVDDMESKYFISGEINSSVADIQVILDNIEKKYGPTAKEILKVDGVSFEYDDWRFNLRSSNTQPLIRLNLEANSKSLMEQKRDELLAIIRA